MKLLSRSVSLILAALSSLNFLAVAQAQTIAPEVSTKQFMLSKFALNGSGLELERASRAGAFYDVVGRKSAMFGYEHRSAEAWAYPLKVLGDLDIAFHIENYPLAIKAADSLTRINVRPEATTFTYSHAAFTVKQTVFAPLDEQGIVILFDVQSVLPLTINVSFRPHLRLAWPGGLGTASLDWNERERVYYITEETQKFVGLIGSPAAKDVSVMPYQEEPRDEPASFRLEFSPDEARANFIPVVIAGSVEGRVKAKATYDKLLADAPRLYEKNVDYYRQLSLNTTRIVTPDKRLDESFAWAKIGVDKGFATNPYLGTGLLAGFRASGASERAGFAWFFGRDALWTSFAINSYGDFNSTRTALEFLSKFQRADGKIPHEISQSATLVDWFNSYPYAFASADATPLYVIAHADLFNATGDTDFLKANWDSILKAYKFTEATDTDGNALIENTRFGHGWIEGGALYPPHEEIYMQGLWVEASRSLAQLAKAIGDDATAARALASTERARAAVEKTYWLADKNFYAYATKLPTAKAIEAEPGANRARRQARLNALRDKALDDEETVLPAVPLWWRTLDSNRAQLEINHLGSAHIATDWGARIISDESELYDPLSYHYGSVWALFTGWSAMAAYRYGRPHVGFQALMANALLYEQNALGYTTELLSGEFNAPFGRSSHHQIWSEAMVVTPIVRGLFGLEANEGGKEIIFAPQLPANWDAARIENFSCSNVRYDFSFKRAMNHLTIAVAQRNNASQKNMNANGSISRVTIAPAFPLDAKIRSVKVNNRAAAFDIECEGDIQRAVVHLANADAANSRIEFDYEEGSDVYAPTNDLTPGQMNEGLRIIRSRADADGLHLTLEGRAGKSYELGLRTARRVTNANGFALEQKATGDARLTIAFDRTHGASLDAASGSYIRREITIPLTPRR